jgi:hypothetical protein
MIAETAKSTRIILDPLLLTMITLETHRISFLLWLSATKPDRLLFELSSLASLIYSGFPHPHLTRKAQQSGSSTPLKLVKF